MFSKLMYSNVATAGEVRRNRPYARDQHAESIPEHHYATIKKQMQALAWEDYQVSFDPNMAYAFDVLVAAFQGNDRSLRALDTLKENVPPATVLHQQLKWMEAYRINRDLIDQSAESAVMATKQELADRTDLVALTFGQLPLTGLSNAALMALINQLLGTRAVLFVTAAAHARMRSHGLRYVVTTADFAQRIVDIMHHQLLFTAEQIVVLSPHAVSRTGFNQLAWMLAVRDAYLKAAVNAASDAPTKLTGGAWPITVEACRKTVAELVAFAA